MRRVSRDLELVQSQLILAKEVRSVGLSREAAKSLDAPINFLRRLATTPAQHLLARTLHTQAVALGDVSPRHKLRAVRRLLREANTIARRLDDSALLHEGLLHLANSLRISGYTAASYRLLKDSLSLNPESGRHHLLLARASALLGDRQRFEEYSSRCRDLLDAHGSEGVHFNEVSVREVSLRGYMDLGAFAQAERTLYIPSPQISWAVDLNLWRTILGITEAMAAARTQSLDDTVRLLTMAARDSLRFGLWRQFNRCVSLAHEVGISEQELRHIIGETDDRVRGASDLQRELRAVVAGQRDWRAFELLIPRILSLSLCPPLEAGSSQIRTVGGHEIIDFTLRNPGRYGFWQMLDKRFESTIIAVEIKNKASLDPEDFNQVSSHLDSARGRAGLLIKRGALVPWEIESAARKLRKEEAVILLGEDELLQLLQSVRLQAAPSDVIERAWAKILEHF